MTRVRELALGMGTGGSAGNAVQGPSEVAGCDSDLLRVIDAQSDWNEDTRKALGEVVQCLQALRDDWIGAQKGLGDEIARLSALVRQQRAATRGALARRKSSVPTARGRRTVASSRTAQVRHATKRGKQRS
jgi:hypothetical protein